MRTPSRNASSPTYCSIIRSTAWPLRYVTASKRSFASSTFFASTEIGWVERSESRLKAGVLCATKSRQNRHSGFRVAVHFSPTQLANDSLSQRSFHQRSEEH